MAADSGQATYTHGHGEPVLRSHRWRTVANSAAYLAPHLREDQVLLDVGCGPGTLTVDLARRVAPRAGRRGDRGARSDLARAEAAAQGQANVDFVVGGRARARPAGRQRRRRARPPGAAARRRPGAGAARDAPGLPAGRPGRGARQRLRRVHLVAGAAGAGPLAGPLPRCGPRQRRRARRRPAAAGLGARGRLHRRHARPRAPGASRPPRTGRSGAACGPTGSSAPRSPSSWSTSGAATPEELQAVAQAWRDWTAHPDGWLSVLHGELLCRP